MNLFTPFKIGDVDFRNRIGVSPMCQYSCDNGTANDWHFVHIGSRAVGGAGLVIMEAAAVEDIGRISPQDLGIWSDAHAEALAPIARFCKSQGAVCGIQLAHAGRKASTHAPWLGRGAIGTRDGGWQPIAPSPLAFSPSDQPPAEMSTTDIRRVCDAFVAAATRAFHAGFELLEIHAAHGYLAHEFLSPLSNNRQDDWGGSFENRIRFLREVIVKTKKVWPERLPLFVRISATDWVKGGWDIEQSVELARILKREGVDLIDVSSGGAVHDAQIPAAPGYQVPFAERIRREAGISTAAVGLITQAHQANDIITSGKADFVLLARELLRDPYWPFHAATELKMDVPWPKQYLRAKP